jgi:hypothetical protein
MSVARISISYLRRGAKSQRLGMAVVLTALWCGAAIAQQSNPVADFLRNALAARSKEIIAATAAMPADKYDFTPSDSDFTFGQLAIHVAVTNLAYCSKIGGVASPGLPPSMDRIGYIVPQKTHVEPKEIVDEVKSSFDFCTTALAKLDDSHNSEQLITPESKQTSRAMAILTLTGAWNDHLTLTNKYFRLSSEPAPAPNPAWRRGPAAPSAAAPPVANN